MLSLVQAGATLIPACPGFYHKPQHIQEMINFVAARVLDHLDIEHNLAPRWKEEM
jgi:4-hydroxy-3-polyprenylbenzoate decarboxylase